jgi:hypothetical protein
MGGNLMLTPVLLLAIPLFVVYLIREARYQRLKRYASLPQLQTSLVWGHMKALYEFIKLAPKDAHIGSLPCLISRAC